MSKKLLRLFILPFYLLTLPLYAPAQSAPAAVHAAATKAASAGHYLSAAALAPSYVRPAPAPGSAADLADFEAILAWQTYRTAEQCAAARAEMSHSFEIFFGGMSPFYDSQAPAVKEFFKNVGEDSVAAHRHFKEVYRRDRPFVRDARVKPCLPRVKGYAYPSGHSTMARLFARILADLVPARSAEFIARADEAALNRVIGGVHHPTDIEAGKALGDALYSELRRSPEFNSDMYSMLSYLK